MENKKKLFLIIGALLVIVGISFAYFTMKIKVEQNSSGITVTTKEIGNVSVLIEGNLSFNDKDILPGYKNISAIKLTAKVDKGSPKVKYYDLIWNGSNTLSSSLDYKVYKADAPGKLSVNCTPREQFLTEGIRYFHDCIMTNEDKLEPISSGTIGINEDTTKVVLKEQESILATNTGTVQYYYVVLEFPNKDEEQIQVENGKFKGEVTIDPAQPLTPTEEILANMTSIVEEDPSKDFSVVSTEETEGVIYEKVVEDTTTTLTNTTSSNVKATLLSEIQERKTYYFSGAPKDNYVIFADHYWRIIRINENGSIRMIYSGNVNRIGSNKKTVLANGYNDSINKYTSYTTSEFNKSTNDNAYVGFKYEKNKLRGTINNSTMFNVLTSWYQTNIANKGYDEYIDADAGFCGDRTAYDNKEGTKTSTSSGIGNHVTYYGAYIRNYTNKTPTFNCAHSDDLYKTKVGLITADEVAYAGGVFYKANTSYYLYTGYRYWTISPSYYDSNEEEPIKARLVDVNVDGGMGYGNTYDSNESVRPVINLKSTVILYGSGTIQDPYIVSLN
ncbi:MAG: hypothetical protein E7163_05135 [Firmicutes bacterium]|nr:hypothetical protein [Bacillota bacterium]